MRDTLVILSLYHLCSLLFAKTAVTLKFGPKQRYISHNNILVMMSLFLCCTSIIEIWDINSYECRDCYLNTVFSKFRECLWVTDYVRFTVWHFMRNRFIRMLAMMNTWRILKQSWSGIIKWIHFDIELYLLCLHGVYAFLLSAVFFDTIDTFYSES